MARRILIVEDEDDIREVAQMALELAAGYDVIPAQSGRVGIGMAERMQPDLILLDVMMPDMDGPRTLRELRANPSMRDIPVIFLTAKAQAAELRELTELGVVGVIAKPFDPMTLHLEIEKLMGWSST